MSQAALYAEPISGEADGDEEGLVRDAPSGDAKCICLFWWHAWQVLFGPGCQNQSHISLERERLSPL